MCLCGNDNLKVFDLELDARFVQEVIDVRGEGEMQRKTLFQEL
jgi:hypothetical protein